MAVVFKVYCEGRPEILSWERRGAVALCQMNPTPIEINWFCVRTKVGLEARISGALSRLSSNIEASVGNLEVYCPRIRTRRMVAGRFQSVLGPMFPGYIFARFCRATAARFVASQPGVVGLVRFGEEPAVLTNETIEELKAADPENACRSCHPPFVPGQQIIIREGPFAGMEAEYVAELKGGERALLFLDYLQRRINLMTDITKLEAAS